MNDPQAPGAAGPRRRVRSFVRRAGRITGAQARALVELWPRFGVDFAFERLDVDALFGRHAPRVLEIGFGNGEALVALAAASPDRDFLGIEVHEPGVGHALLRAQTLGLTNLRVSRHDAVEVLEEQVPEESLAEAVIFFPDPWPKSRHHKRRLVQPDFATLLARKLERQGVLRLATDWQHYAQQMLEVLNSCPLLVNCSTESGYVARPASRPPTRFELRGRRLGHDVWDLAFQRR